MSDEKRITISRIFDASRQAVWDAWTKPEIVKQWWGPEGFWAPSVTIDLKVGGRYVFGMHGPKGTPFDNDSYSAGEYKEIDPPKKLVITDYFSDANGIKTTPASAGLDPNFPAEMFVTVNFEDTGDGKTRLTIQYPPAQSELEWQAMQKSQMVDGWNSSLNKLAKLVEVTTQ